MSGPKEAAPNKEMEELTLEYLPKVDVDEHNFGEIDNEEGYFATLRIPAAFFKNYKLITAYQGEPNDEPLTEFLLETNLLDRLSDMEEHYDAMQILNELDMALHTDKLHIEYMKDSAEIILILDNDHVKKETGENDGRIKKPQTFYTFHDRMPMEKPVGEAERRDEQRATEMEIALRKADREAKGLMPETPRYRLLPQNKKLEQFSKKK